MEKIAGDGALARKFIDNGTRRTIIPGLIVSACCDVWIDTLITLNKDLSEPGLLLHVSDRSLHQYMQQYPYCTGPDEELNQKCFAALRRDIEIRWPKNRWPMEPLRRSELVDEESIQAAASKLLQTIGLSEVECADRLRGRAWKVCLARPDAESILALGCGEGDEIASLRARAPRSRIVGLDWIAKCLPGLLDAAEAEFVQGDFDDLLLERPSAFDLVFSNHVIEHSFEPETLLRSIHACLKPGGRLVSALPLEAATGDPIFEKVLSLAKDPSRVQRSDMFILSVGHPYKTNASDLAQTLFAAGFKEVRVAYRPWRPTLDDSLDIDVLDESRARHMRLYRASTGLLLRMANGVFRDPPLAALRVWGAIDSRWPFGLTRMRTHKTIEAVVVACA